MIGNGEPVEPKDYGKYFDMKRLLLWYQRCVSQGLKPDRGIYVFQQGDYYTTMVEAEGFFYKELKKSSPLTNYYEKLQERAQDILIEIENNENN